MHYKCFEKKKKDTEGEILNLKQKMRRLHIIAIKIIFELRFYL